MKSTYEGLVQDVLNELDQQPGLEEELCFMIMGVIMSRVFNDSITDSFFVNLGDEASEELFAETQVRVILEQDVHSNPTTISVEIL